MYFSADWSFRHITCNDEYWCEFRLDRLFKNLGPDTCLTTSNKFMVTQYAMKKIIELVGFNTPCGEDIEPDSCLSNFSMTWAGCWRFLGDSVHVGTPGDTLVPCGQREICCYSVWQLCKDSNGDPLPATKLSNQGLNPYCSGTCFGICEDLPPPSPSDIEDDNNIGNGFTTFVFPNPSRDIINIRLISDTVGEHQIEVFDIAGNLILTHSLTKQQNEELIQLKMGNYSNGSYNYVIKHNGIPSINGSFKLLKFMINFSLAGCCQSTTGFKENIGEI